MGTISKFSATQYEAMNENVKSNLTGVTLVYRSTNSKGETHESAVNFSGDEYSPANRKQDEIFRVWKNVVQTFWNVKILEASLKKDNGGIATKLRSSTPAAIVVRTADKKQAEKWDIESSIWQRIGLVPTKRDMEECAREYKKKMHKAAKASFDALNFRAKFDDDKLPEMERANIPEEPEKKEEK
ncbi:hypothetical protein [Phocaeicola plebeius]|mgnify:CR=1 FL=1|uniref:hypothetical protein n=1 Tax=Phocaeicola plebeius TaxID=310297 RepID=UPI003AB2FCAD